MKKLFKSGPKPVRIEDQLKDIDSTRGKLHKQLKSKYKSGKAGGVDVSTFVVMTNILDHAKVRIMREYVNPKSIPTEYFIAKQNFGKVKPFEKLKSKPNPLRSTSNYKKVRKEMEKEGKAEEKKKKKKEKKKKEKGGGGLFGKIFRKKGNEISSSVQQELYKTWMNTQVKDITDDDLRVYSEIIGSNSTMIPEKVQKRMHEVVKWRVRLINDEGVRNVETFVNRQTSLGYYRELVHEFVKAQSKVWGKPPYPKVKSGGGELADAFNKMIEIEMCVDGNPAFIHMSQTRIMSKSSRTRCVFNAHLSGGTTSVVIDVKNASFIKDSKLIIFIPLQENLNNLKRGKVGLMDIKFNLKPASVSFDEFATIVRSGRKMGDGFTVFTVEHRCNNESFMITYVIMTPKSSSNMIKRYSQTEIKVGNVNHMFVNVVSDMMDGMMKRRTYGEAVNLFTIAYKLSKNSSQITCFHLLKRAFSIFVKNVLYGTIEHVKIGRGSSLMNRIIYITGLLTILSCHFRDSGGIRLDRRNVDSLLRIIRSTLVKHLMLYTFKLGSTLKSECTNRKLGKSMDVTNTYFEIFKDIKMIDDGPTEFTKTIKNGADVIYPLKMLEDVFISSIFISKLFNTGKDLEYERCWRWTWDSRDDIVKYIDEGSYEKVGTTINSKSLNIFVNRGFDPKYFTQSTFDDDRIEWKDKPIGFARTTMDLDPNESEDMKNICNITIYSTFNAEGLFRPSGDDEDTSIFDMVDTGKRINLNLKYLKMNNFKEGIVRKYGSGLSIGKMIHGDNLKGVEMIINV